MHHTYEQKKKAQKITTLFNTSNTNRCTRSHTPKSPNNSAFVPTLLELVQNVTLKENKQQTRSFQETKSYIGR